VLKKNLHLWFPAYIRKTLKWNPRIKKPLHIVFTIVDHFEPYWGKVSHDTALKRVKTWVDRLPEIAGRHVDSRGTSPKYTFFYPEEEYKYEYLDMLEGLCRRGYGDVEIHLHHDNDTPEGLREKLVNFKTVLYERHGLLRRDKKTGKIMYGFIHGNWALDNSRRDGRWCGVNNELIILKETGCYADFTLPSAPSDTQTSKINSIYYAKDDPEKPKSHNTGIDVTSGKKPGEDLMIIQGPLAVNWNRRKYGIFPRIETGEISYSNPPTLERVDLWVKQHIHVRGKPEWIFIKIHTHGTQEKNSEMLLNGGLERIYKYLEEGYNDGKNYILHYVSAFEMYNIIKAAEAGKTDSPSVYKNYII